jgi:hypothetical protein
LYKYCTKRQKKTQRPESGGITVGVCGTRLCQWAKSIAQEVARDSIEFSVLEVAGYEFQQKRRAPAGQRPRQYSDEQLMAVLQMNSSIGCECPRQGANCRWRLAFELGADHVIAMHSAHQIHREQPQLVIDAVFSVAEQ